MYKLLAYPAIAVMCCLTHSIDCWANSPTLSYYGSAQVEIITVSGRRVLIDVVSPSDLPIPPVKEDILLTTHNHPDHLNRDFQAEFPGHQLTDVKGHIDFDDVSVMAIASSHLPEDISEMQPTNIIFLVETGGVRILHLGDIGQENLTSEQLKIIDRVDVLVTQFENELSQMTVDNLKGFNIVQQIAPRLVIPTHHAGLAALAAAQNYFQCFAQESGPITLSMNSLPQGTNFLIMGNLASVAVEDFSCNSLPEGMR